MDDGDFGSLGLQIKAHWEKYRPRMVKELKAAGKYDQALQEARDLTSNALADLLQAGVPHNQAWESVREEWAFLPSEEDQKSLPPDRNPANPGNPPEPENRPPSESPPPSRSLRRTPPPATTASPSETPSALAAPETKPAAT